VLLLAGQHSSFLSLVEEIRVVRLDRPMIAARAIPRAVSAATWAIHVLRRAGALGGPERFPPTLF
jgi:hypothetical protein